MKNGPCYQCQKRTVKCHDTCPEYNDWVKGVREANAKESRERQLDKDIRHIRRQAILKAKRGQ